MAKKSRSSHLVLVVRTTVAEANAFRAAFRRKAGDVTFGTTAGQSADSIRDYLARMVDRDALKVVALPTGGKFNAFVKNELEGTAVTYVDYDPSSDDVPQAAWNAVEEHVRTPATTSA